MKLGLLAFAFAPVPALSVLAFGCSVSAPATSSGFGTTTTIYPYAADAGDAAVTVAEAGDAAPPPSQGSRLCLQGPIATCNPDTSNTASLCHEAPDGGVWDPTATYGDAGLACRVNPAQSLSPDGGPTAACSQAGIGTDGTSCSYASECAAGLDCVGTPGTCRHYCCAGNSVCAKDQFCDTQPLAVATTTQVPVCMPITPAGGCELATCAATAATGAMTCPGCPNKETCSVVRDDGATGCVQTGNAKAGDPCDTDHCGIGQVCLGSASAASNTPGSRRCYALCLTSSSSSCVAPATCQGGLPLFQDPSVGVCR